MISIRLKRIKQLKADLENETKDELQVLRELHEIQSSVLEELQQKYTEQSAELYHDECPKGWVIFAGVSCASMALLFLLILVS